MFLQFYSLLVSAWMYTAISQMKLQNPQIFLVVAFIMNNFVFITWIVIHLSIPTISKRTDKIAGIIYYTRLTTMNVTRQWRPIKSPRKFADTFPQLTSSSSLQLDNHEFFILKQLRKNFLGGGGGGCSWQMCLIRAVVNFWGHLKRTQHHKTLKKRENRYNQSVW